MEALLIAVAIMIGTIFVGEGSRRKSETKKLKAEVARLNEKLNDKGGR